MTEDTSTLPPPTPSAPVVPKTPPRIAAFLAQPNGTLVGPGKPFATLADLCKWLRQEAGYEAVSLFAGEPCLDVGLAAASHQYCYDRLGFFADLGTPAIRMESHIVGQRMLVHPAELCRFKGFAGPKLAELSNDVGFHEAAAADEMVKVIQATHNLGFKRLVDFSGNRAWTAANYPWSAYPKHLLLKALLLVFLKHRNTLRLCAELGIVKGLELHPGEDLNSPYLLWLFRELVKKVAPEIVPAIGANFDASHPTLIGDDAAKHAAFLADEGLLSMCHLKDGERWRHLSPTSPELRGGSIRGDFAGRWSLSPRRFCTFGLGMADWSKILPILLQAHQDQAAGLDFVVEAECSRLPNMLQGLKVGAENARRARAGKALLEVSDVVPEPADGGNWEQFAVTEGLLPDTMLAMGLQESLDVAGLVKDLDDLDPAIWARFS